ncbi:hypothetical protein OG786_29225 [Streptomyces sp. NBC_00101]|uniref:hypothetical protein n=1 Tax=Streptomyces sp. NBC_00101 TaxID=2975651 RepID=UPI00324DCF1E
MPHNNPTQPTSRPLQEHRSLTGWQVLAILVVPPVVLAEIVIGITYTPALAQALLEANSLVKSLVIGAVISVGVLLAELVPEEADPAEDESRQRLTQAESALANALRGTQTHESGEAITRPQQVEDNETPTGELSFRQRPLGLSELWEATHARLDLYHQIATGQAKTSFRNAQVAMVAGFTLLVLFAGIALWASTTAVAIVAGGLGAVSAALAGYVAKTFIRSQEAAATHLRSYFDQPLELSRYLAAERLVADGDLTQEQRGEILSALVQAMVAGPPPPQASPSVVVASVPGQQQGA